MTNPAALNVLKRLNRWAWGIGAVALVLAAMGWFWWPRSFLFGYLTAFLFWLSVPLGCGAILMTHHLTGGRWGWSIRGVLEAALTTLPLLAILFIPIALGLAHLYPWAGQADAVAVGDPLPHNRAYLNEPFFLARAALFLVVWTLGGWWLAHASRRQAIHEADSLALKLQRSSAAGLIVYALTVTFAAVDWLGSLQPEWFSTVLGMYLLVNQALTAMTLAILAALLAWWGRWEPAALPISVRHDLGNLLLMLVVLNAYLAFSQFLIIWNGNLPREVSWYVPRVQGGWGAVATLLIVIQFFVPLAALLFRDVKRGPRTLGVVTLLVLAAQLIGAAWLVLPSMQPTAPAAVLLSVAAMVGVGGLWLGAFTRQWSRWGGPTPTEPPALQEPGQARA